MSTVLPLDSNNNPIPALRLKKNGAHQINVSAASARNAAAFKAETRIVSLYATEDMYVSFGDDTITAVSSDHFFPAGIYYDVALGGGAMGHCTHIAACRVQTDGILYISEKE